jgi:hypothetical protein
MFLKIIESIMKTTITFHKAPEGYSYEFVEFNKNLIQIWIHNHFPFSHSDGNSIRSIWGFYSKKGKIFYAPITANKPGKVVIFQSTSPYSAMIPKKRKLY